MLNIAKGNAVLEYVVLEGGKWEKMRIGVRIIMGKVFRASMISVRRLSIDNGDQR